MHIENAEKTYKTCCFTGHRTLSRSDIVRLTPLLDNTLRSLYRSGVTEYRAGGAIGFDTLAALRVLYLRECGLNIRLHLILPCKSQADRWPLGARQDYAFILRKADSVSYVSQEYTQTCMHARNRALVDGSDVCVAYLTKNQGGTAHTVAYAIKNGLALINLGI